MQRVIQILLVDLKNVDGQVSRMQIFIALINTLQYTQSDIPTQIQSKTQKIQIQSKTQKIQIQSTIQKIKNK